MDKKYLREHETDPDEGKVGEESPGTKSGAAGSTGNG
jgi:hypothetical protein